MGLFKSDKSAPASRSLNAAARLKPLPNRPILSDTASEETLASVA